MTMFAVRIKLEPKHEDDIYYFQDWNLIQRSVDMTCYKMPEDKRPKLVKTPMFVGKWEIVNPDGTLFGSVIRMDQVKVETEAIHF